MPLTRYFLYVGGVLLTLLFIADFCLPESPVAERASIHLPAIRIHSDRKWPDRIVFDTSLPTIVPAQPANAETSVPAPVTVADATPGRGTHLRNCNRPGTSCNHLIQESGNLSSGNALQGIAHRHLPTWCGGNHSLAGLASGFGEHMRREGDYHESSV
jgi:hypothetical protein